MRAFSCAVALAVLGLVGFQANAETTEEVLKQAQAAFAQRDYTPAGVAQAQIAVDRYTTLAAAATDKTQKASLLAAKSEAIYFVADANDNNDIKIKTFLEGMNAADQGMQLMGLSSIAAATASTIDNLKATLTPEQIAILGNLLYQRGANLGQWGQANGVMQSLSKWPELRDSMQVIIDLGLKEQHEYGAYRVLGRGYFKVPGLFGGSTAKAMKYLAAAVNNTKKNATDVHSINGYNNLYYAEILKDQGKDEQAKAILTAFIAADPATLLPESLPETKRNQLEAAAMLKNW